MAEQLNHMNANHKVAGSNPMHQLQVDLLKVSLLGVNYIANLCILELQVEGAFTEDSQ